MRVRDRNERVVVRSGASLVGAAGADGDDRTLIVLDASYRSKRSHAERSLVLRTGKSLVGFRVLISDYLPLFRRRDLIHAAGLLRAEEGC